MKVVDAGLCGNLISHNFLEGAPVDSILTFRVCNYSSSTVRCLHARTLMYWPWNPGGGGLPVRLANDTTHSLCNRKSLIITNVFLKAKLFPRPALKKGHAANLPSPTCLRWTAFLWWAVRSSTLKSLEETLISARGVNWNLPSGECSQINKLRLTF